MDERKTLLVANDKVIINGGQAVQCFKCKALIYISPSSVAMMKDDPSITPICPDCFTEETQGQKLNLHLHAAQARELKDLGFGR